MLPLARFLLYQESHNTSGLSYAAQYLKDIAKEYFRTMLSFILWLIIGGVIGWLASLVMGTDAQQGLLLNIVVGIVGAFLGGLLFNLLGFGGVNINNSDFSLPSLIVSFIGAVVLLGIVNLFRRGTVR